MTPPVEWPPGSTEARAQGCTCQMRDGEMQPGNPDWPDWLTLDCPVHGHKLAPVEEGENRR